MHSRGRRTKNKCIRKILRYSIGHLLVVLEEWSFFHSNKKKSFLFVGVYCENKLQCARRPRVLAVLLPETTRSSSSWFQMRAFVAFTFGHLLLRWRRMSWEQSVIDRVYLHIFALKQTVLCVVLTSVQTITSLNLEGNKEMLVVVGRRLTEETGWTSRPFNSAASVCFLLSSFI